MRSSAQLLAPLLVAIVAACSASLEVELGSEVPVPVGPPVLAQVSVTPTGAVHVVSAPPGIDCGGAAIRCVSAFVPGTAVLLSTTGAGPALARWDGPCAGAGRDCALVVTTSTTLAVEGLASGDTAWARLVGGASFDQALSVAIGSGGTAIIAGAFSGTIEDLGLTAESGSVDALLVGIDARTGTVRWGERGGGTGSDLATKVAANASRIAVAGSSSSASFGWGGLVGTAAGGVDAFQVTLDQDRTTLSVQGGETAGTDYALTTDLFPNGSVVTAGIDGIHMFVSKRAAGDDLDWSLLAAAYVASGSTGEVVTEVVVTPDGDVIVAGFFSGDLDIGGTDHTAQGPSDAFVMRLDGTTGAFEWLTQIGGTGQETCNGLALLSNGDIVTGGAAFVDFSFGSSTVNADAGGLDGWVAILSDTGAPVWATGYGGPGDEFTSDVGVGLDDSIYVAGRGTGITFGPFPGATFGGDDAFVGKLSSNATHAPVWLRVFGGPGSDQARNPTIGPGGGLYVTGSVEGTVNLGLGLSGSHGGRDAFLVLLAP